MIAESRLLRLAEKNTPYRQYRAKRLGTRAPSVPAGYAITIRRSSRNDMDRMDGPSFAGLDRVIMDLSKMPAPPGCMRLKWLLPDLRIVRRGGYVVVYAIDNKARMLRLLRIAYDVKSNSKPLRKRTPGPKGRAPAPAGKGLSPIDLDWHDGYSGQALEELLSFEKYGRTDLLVAAITQAIEQKAQRRGRLSQAERVILAAGTLDAAMVTGGFDNFFTYWPQFASSIVESLLHIGCKRLAKTTQRALDVLGLKHMSPKRVSGVMAKWDERLAEKLERCSMSYWKSPGPARQLFAFIKANRDQIRL